MKRPKLIEIRCDQTIANKMGNKANSNLSRQAVILSGGLGERLRPLTNSIPKPLVHVNGIPFLDFLLMSLITAGFRDFLFLVGYLGEQIVERYQALNGVSTRFSMGSIEDQTGRRLLNAKDLLSDEFLVVYGDTYLPMTCALADQLLLTENMGARMTVFSNVKGTGEYGRENNVRVEGDGYVTTYDQTRQDPELNGLDIGYLSLRKEVLDFSAKGNLDLGKDILTSLVRQGAVRAVVTDTQYFYLTSRDSLDRFSEHAKKFNFASLSHLYFNDKNERPSRPSTGSPYPT